MNHLRSHREDATFLMRLFASRIDAPQLVTLFVALVAVLTDVLIVMDIDIAITDAE